MKYLRIFETTNERDQVLNMVPYGVISYVENSSVMVHSGMPNNEIWYTSSDGTVVTPDSLVDFGANIVSNTYENGKGVIKFNGPVTNIGSNAFYNRNILTSINIPNTVTTIGNNAFDSCSSLTSITIPNVVTSIGDVAFTHCTGLTSITIPSSVTSIGNGVFTNCTGLTSVTIGNSVTSVGHEVFNGCTDITSITSLNTTPPTIQSSTLPYHTTYIIYVPSGSIDTYKAASKWSNHASQIQAIQS